MQLLMKLKKLSVKDASKSNDYGRIIHKKHFKKLESDIKNQNVIYGGKKNIEDLYFEPTIVDRTF